MAASLAYYLFGVLLPLVLFVVIGLSLLGGGSLQWVIELASGTLLPPGTRVPRSVLANTGGQLRAAVIGGAILAWSAFRLFGALDGAVATVYDTREHTSLVGRVLDSLLVLLTVGAAIAAMVGLGVGLLFVAPERSAIRIVGPIFLLVTLTAVFLPTFVLLPEVDVPLAQALPGTLFAAAIWTISAAFFRFYATLSESVQLYGIAGGVLLILTWLYVAGLAVLVGATINAVLAGHVDPDAGWLPEDLADRLARHTDADRAAGDTEE
ncbi:YihY/virulence factor BrkB family protein [Halobacteriales archaeon QS_3_64_16]|nr:MAG: YihY/virulence factor BrkB family protein [Halobacteriales archaeon QS_3_64_16]